MVRSPQIQDDIGFEGSYLSKLLEQRLELNRENLRTNQIRSIEKLIHALKRGVFQGLIKQPTGAGKTRLFGEILHALHLPSLVLVPRSNLIEQTKKELFEVGYEEEEIKSIEPKGNRGAAAQVRKAIENISNSPNGHVILMTYQSFLSIAKKETLLNKLLSQVKVVISDEAHRSLGEQTKERLREIDESVTTQTKRTRKKILKSIKKDEEEMFEEVAESVLADEEEAEVQEILEDEREERQIESFTKKHRDIVHLRLTATPRLAEKDVQDVFGIEVIDWVRIQQLVEDGTLILPQLIETGTTTYSLEEGDEKYISDNYLSQVAEEDRFRMEDGRSVLEANTKKYLELKEQCGGTLPAVAFCGTVAQAQKYLEYIRSLGLLAVRVTSASGEYDRGASPEVAKQMLEEGRVDVVVTVSKVGEGWDVPGLQCAIWNVPTQSPARCLQGNGRIMRSAPGKSRENTFIIEPHWLITKSVEKPEREQTVSEKTEENETTEGTEKKLYVSQNFFERLLELDEIDIDTLRKMGINTEKIREKIDLTNDEHLRLLIGSVDRLIVNGRGVSLKKMRFSCEESGWEVSGGQIGRALWRKNAPGSTEAEELARRLWPEEAECLFPKEKIDLTNDDHLRRLIGSVDRLIEDGKGVNLKKMRFSCEERGWKVSGRQIGYALWRKNGPGSAEAEELARRLWPEEAGELIIDLTNDEHLRRLIGSVDRLIENGRGVSLRRMIFSCEEREWEVNGRQIGFALWRNDHPGSREAEELAKRLWPEEAKKLLATKD